MSKGRIINQNELTSECWLVQFQGLNACKNCSSRGTRECGGKNIRKRLMNAKGKSVPLGQEY